MKKFIIKHKCLLLTILFIFIAFLIFGLNTFHNNIWYDEAHQMLLNRLSYLEIIQESKNDTSGPLFALILKFVTSIFGSHLFVARLTSLSLFCGVFVLAFYPIKRLFNLKTSIIFSIIMLFSSFSFFASIEIRNYSLAMLSTLGSVVYCLLYLKDSKKGDFIKYFIFSLMALYSHVYAMVSIVFLIIASILYDIFKKKDIKFIGVNVLLIILFIPWINVILGSQKDRVVAEFWVQRPNIETLISSVKELFVSDFGISFVMLGMFFFGFIYSLIKYKSSKEMLFLFIPSFICLAFFFIWSLYKTPLFVTKYIVPVCGILYLIIAKSLSDTDLISLPVVFILLFIPNFVNCYLDEKKLINDESVYTMIDYIGNVPIEDRAFYNTYEFGLGISEYYFPNSKHYIKENSNISLTGPDIFGKLIINESISEKYIIAFSYIGESESSFVELFEQGYVIVDNMVFYNAYNSGCSLYILEKVV